VREVFLEEGIVEQVRGGEAEVRLTGGDHCTECSAKALCRTGSDEDARRLTTAALPGLQAGDRVKVEVQGSSLLQASGLLYGIPLALLLAGIFGGSVFFGEVGAALLGLALPLGYALGLVVYARMRPRQVVLPKVRRG
jgi:positive regulator of sigma E activity